MLLHTVRFICNSYNTCKLSCVISTWVERFYQVGGNWMSASLELITIFEITLNE